MMISSIFITVLLTISSVIHYEKNEEIKVLTPEQHPNVLLYDYNECSYSSTYDGEDKSWFALEKSGVEYHFPHSNNVVSTIKYYINETSATDPTLNWNYNMPNNYLGEQVKQNFLNSILKWNNIYFYYYSSNQFVTKKKLVNVIEGTSSDYNFIIYPEKTTTMVYSTSAAETGPIGSPSFEVTENSVVHRHYNTWHISLNLESPGINTNNNNYYLNRYGAHEFGHVLGLRDIDTIEGCGNHHGELLMGYASPHQAEITYKDLVGAAITRGLHTDDDHSWIYDYTSSSEGNRKLICSICNGVRYVDSLVGYDYVTYKGCNNLHNLSSGKMFPVASYGNKDYYKCKYCRYVAPFTSLVDQDYVATDHYNSTYHIVTNQVNGLSYSCLEEHTFDSNGVCTGCSQISSHSFNNNYVYYTSNTHKAYCTCGTYILKSHAIDGTRTYTFHGHLYGPCIDCGAIVDLGGEGPIIPVPNIINQMITDNGSFIMESGIYYIVEEDLEAYINGTLIFHPYNEIID